VVLVVYVYDKNCIEKSAEERVTSENGGACVIDSNALPVCNKHRHIHEILETLYHFADSCKYT
jgi:hypothetical protein